MPSKKATKQVLPVLRQSIKQHLSINQARKQSTQSSQFWNNQSKFMNQSSKKAIKQVLPVVKQSTKQSNSQWINHLINPALPSSETINHLIKQAKNQLWVNRKQRWMFLVIWRLWPSDYFSLTVKKYSNQGVLYKNYPIGLICAEIFVSARKKLFSSRT